MPFIRFGQARDVPLLGIGIRGDMRGDEIVDDLMAHLGDGFVQIRVA